VHVEVHQHLLDRPQPTRLAVEELSGDPLTFSIGESGFLAHSIGCDDLLLHLCWHMQAHAAGLDGLRLIWAADILGVAEKFDEDLDWEKLTYTYPLVLQTLARLDELSPLPEKLHRRLPSPRRHDMGLRRSAGAGYRGWPEIPFNQRRTVGFWKLSRETLFPSPWWLALVYGKSLNEPGCLPWLRRQASLAGYLGIVIQKRFKNMHKDQVDANG
jgi:hypothetical protein